MKPIRTYEVSVSGFPPFNVSARSRGNAIGQAWRSYSNAYDSATFKEFLKICRVARVPDPPHVLKRVLISGKPATTTLGPGGRPAGSYVYFMRDDSDVILRSHPSDVTELPA